VPDDLALVGAVTGALLPLTYPENWEQFGTMTPEQAAGVMSAAFEAFVASDCVGGECPPPTIIAADGEPKRIYRKHPTTGKIEQMVDDETWEKYRRKEFGFKATLKLARGGDAAVDEAETPPVEETQGDPVPAVASPAVVPIVDPILPKLAKMLKMHKLAPGKHTALVDVDDYAVQVLFTVKGKN